MNEIYKTHFLDCYFLRLAILHFTIQPSTHPYHLFYFNIFMRIIYLLMYNNRCKVLYQEAKLAATVR